MTTTPSGAACWWEVDKDDVNASDNNGGGFDSTLTGPSSGSFQRTPLSIGNPNITISVNTNVITFTGGVVGYTPTAADVGNFVQFSAGTNIAGGVGGVWKITNFTGTTWTVLPNPLVTAGPQTDFVGVMGGVRATIDSAALDHGSDQTIWVKKASTPYTITATINLNLGGPNEHRSRLKGFTSTHTNHLTGDDPLPNSGNQPIIQTNGAIAAITMGVGGFSVENIELDGNGATRGTNGIANGTSFSLGVKDCVIKNFAGDGITISGGSANGVNIYRSYFTNNNVSSGTAAVISTTSITVQQCYFVGNNLRNVSLSGGVGHLWGNVFSGGTNGANIAGSGTVMHNVFHGASAKGLALDASVIDPNRGGLVVMGNLFTSNTGAAISLPANKVTRWPEFDYNGFFSNNGSTASVAAQCTNYGTVSAHEVNLTASPYVGVPDFSLNTTAGAGLAAIDTAAPGTGTIPGFTTYTGTQDMGVFSAADALASSGSQGKKWLAATRRRQR